MIVVKVELHSAITGRITELGRAVIGNLGINRSGSRGDYEIRVGRRGDSRTQQCLDNPVRAGRVLNWPRESYSVWRLVARCLLEAFPEEKRRKVKGKGGEHGTESIAASV